jgi:hypothetical protein
MGAMMWFMMRGGRQKQAQDTSLPELKAEQARLAEKIVTLEQQNAEQAVEREEVERDEDADLPSPAQVR